jgi:hypothetical protein
VTRIDVPYQSLIRRLVFHREFAYCDYIHFFLQFKNRAGSLRSNSGRTLCSDLTTKICLPLQRSEILLQPFSHSLPSIIPCSLSFTFLNLSFVCLSSSLFPSMTSIRFLLTEFSNKNIGLIMIQLVLHLNYDIYIKLIANSYFYVSMHIYIPDFYT